MMLEYAAKTDAQAKADAIHQWMIDNVPAYRSSVSTGQTLRWDFPKQPTDATGKVTSTNWQVTVKPRCDGALSPSEKLAVVVSAVQDTPA